MRLVAYNSCDELLDGLRTTTAERVGPYGLYGRGLMEDGGAGVARGGDSEARNAVPAAPKAAGPGAQQQAPEHSGTNVHEAGADEPDMVKTDGRRIVVLARNRLQVIDPVTRKVVHRLKLPDAFAGSGQLLLSGDRALILSGGSGVYQSRFGDHPVGGQQTTLLMVDLAGAPKIVNSMTTEAGFLDARMSGSVARVVVRSSPRIEFPRPDEPWRSNKAATERNRQVVRNAPVEAWLPTFKVRDGDSKTGGRDYRVPCERVSRPADNPGSSMVSVLTVDLAKGLGDPQTVSIAAEGQTVYGNGANLYVTGTRWMDPGGGFRPRGGEQRTEVHQFETTGSGQPRYLASGAVPGNLLNQYSMSEHGGHLRLATTSGQTWAPAESGRPSQSSIHVLQRRGAQLAGVGKVDGLGKGERIYAVRFLGSLGYVVTFRQVDPLYVVDLATPAAPKVTGELKITGYSAYLHPVADGRLLGVGQDATKDGRTTGTQVSLFDVNGQPRRVSAFRLPGTSSEAEFEPHAFLFWPKSGLTVIPVANRTDGGTRAIVLNVNADGIRQVGSVQHPRNRGYTPIQRSLVIGSTLWTVSEGGARASDATSLAQQGWVGFDDV